MLGFPVKINIDVNAVWAYAQDMGAGQAGSTFTGSAKYLLQRVCIVILIEIPCNRYIDGFISALKSYVDRFGDLGKEYFKNAVTKGELTVTVNELGASVRLFFSSSRA